MTSGAAQRALPIPIPILLLLGVLAALVLGEVLLRVLRPPQLAVVRYPCIYQPDPVLGFRYVPGASGRVAAHFEIDNPVETNTLGFYDDEPEAGDPSPRVLAVGDSFTAAMNVPRPQVWTAVLERALRAAGSPRADVVNLGLDGTGTDVHADLLREYVPRLAPDTVLLAFYANDVVDVMRRRFQRECYEGFVLSYQTEAQREALRARIDAHRAKRARIWLHETSYLARLVASLRLPPTSPYRLELQQTSLAELGPEARDALRGRRRFRAALREIEAIAASCDCRVAVVPVPPRRTPDGSLDLWRRRAEGSRLEVIDVLPALARARERRGLVHEDLYFRHDNHLNATGNELFGEAVARALLRR